MNISKFSPNRNEVLMHNNVVNFSGLSVKPQSKFFKPVNRVAQPAVKVYDSLAEQVAKGIGKILNSDFVFKEINKTKRSKLLMNHLMTFGSIILSGFYVLRTLGNKDLEDKKKRTLAINQTAVFGLSTVMCYTLDGLLNKSVAKFTNRFEAVNHTTMPKEVLAKCVKGMPAAKSVAIFDIIYRFIAPVMITPIANHIGNKLNEKKEAEITHRPINKIA